MRPDHESVAGELLRPVAPLAGILRGPQAGDGDWNRLLPTASDVRDELLEASPLGADEPDDARTDVAVGAGDAGMRRDGVSGFLGAHRQVAGGAELRGVHDRQRAGRADAEDDDRQHRAEREREHRPSPPDGVPGWHDVPHGETFFWRAQDPPQKHEQQPEDERAGRDREGDDLSGHGLKPDEGLQGEAGDEDDSAEG